MSQDDSSAEHSNQRATDEELWAILRKVKEEDEIPSLLTSQFNDIWDYDYSNYGLNQRLRKLHDEGIVGHQKAAGRHMWWLSGVGTTESVELSTLENLIDYEDLNPERFSEEKANEIATAVIPGFEKNWWHRVHRYGDDVFRVGAGIFAIVVGVLVSGSAVLPDPLLGSGLIAGMVLMSFGILQWMVGKLGNIFSHRDWLPAEPWESGSLSNEVQNRLALYLKGMK